MKQATLKIHDIETTLGTLMRTWEGMDNAELILEDVANTISFELLQLGPKGRRAFLNNCRARALLGPKEV